MYKLENNGCVTKKDTNTLIPIDEGNRDYRDYLAWLAAGNTPEPADPVISTTTETPKDI